MNNVMKCRVLLLLGLLAHNNHNQNRAYGFLALLSEAFHSRGTAVDILRSNYCPRAVRGCEKEGEYDTTVVLAKRCGIYDVPYG